VGVKEVASGGYCVGAGAKRRERNTQTRGLRAKTEKREGTRTQYRKESEREEVLKEDD